MLRTKRHDVERRRCLLSRAASYGILELDWFELTNGSTLHSSPSRRRASLLPMMLIFLQEAKLRAWCNYCSQKHLCEALARHLGGDEGRAGANDAKSLPSVLQLASGFA